MRIVCDTNIWYDIAVGGIEKNSLVQYKLHPTYVNLTELAKTPKLLEDIPLVQAAVKALYKNNAGIFEINPIEFIIRKQFPKYKCKDSAYESILKSFETLMRIDASAKVEDSIMADMKKDIEEHKDGLRKVADSINELLPTIRENIKKSTGKKLHRSQKSLPIFFEVINVFVKEYTKGEITLKVESYPFDELELFIRVWDNFFKDLEVSPDQKFQPNDWSDLFNMVYVGKGHKYSTSEKKWIRLIEKDEHTKPYLILLTEY